MTLRTNPDSRHSWSRGFYPNAFLRLQISGSNSGVGLARPQFQFALERADGDSKGASRTSTIAVASFECADYRCTFQYVQRNPVQLG